jgi:hypothetical protein
MTSSSPPPPPLTTPTLHSFPSHPSSILWNRAWPTSCDVLPPFPLDDDNAALADVRWPPPHLWPPGRGPGGATTVFVPHAALPRFLAEVWPAVGREQRVVLVTGLADPGPAASLGLRTAPRWGPALPRGHAHAHKPSGGAAAEDPAACAPLAGVLSDPRLVSWWSENLDFSHPKAAPLPLGVDLHTLAGRRSAERSVWGGPAPHELQASELWAARGRGLARGEPSPSSSPFSPSPPPRDPRVYVHFGLVNRRRLAVLQAVKERGDLWALGPGMEARAAGTGPGPGGGGSRGPHLVSRAEAWGAMASHAWVASIEGYGLDCHRTWEALALGAGVVVQDTPFTRRVLEGFPALFVPPGPPASWATHVTREALDGAWRTWLDATGAAASPGTDGGAAAGPPSSPTSSPSRAEAAAHARAELRLRPSWWIERIRTWRPVGEGE